MLYNCYVQYSKIIIHKIKKKVGMAKRVRTALTQATKYVFIDCDNNDDVHSQLHAFIVKTYYTESKRETVCVCVYGGGRGGWGYKGQHKHEQHMLLNFNIMYS